MRWTFMFSEMWQGLRRNLAMTIATILTIALALAFLGGAWLFGKQTHSTHDFWFGKIEISVFLDKNVTPAQHDAIQQELSSLPQVRQIFYEDQHTAYLRFKQEFRSVPALVKNTTESQLPESFRVKLKNPKQFAVVAEAVQNMPGVDQVAAEPEALKKLFNFFDGLQNVALIAAGVILIVAILLIFNNVRIAAYTRRREVGIMRLVGASDVYIQGPFLMEMVVCAVLAGVLASGVIVFTKAVLIDQQVKDAFGGNQLLDIIGWGQVLGTLPYLFIAGILLSAITAVLTLQRYLRV